MSLHVPRRSRLAAAGIGAGGILVSAVFASTGFAGAATSPTPSPSPSAGATHGPRAGHFGAGRFGHRAELTAAAAAIGIPVEQLRTELTPGTSLAAVARAHKVDPQKVIDALVTADKARLATEVKDGRLTQAQADSITAALPQHVADRVNGTRPADVPGGPGGFRAGRGLNLTAAAAAIGIPVAQLRTELTPGTSLATVAGNHKVDPQKVIDALVAADRARLATAVKNGALTQAQAEAAAATLPQRVADRVNGTGPADGPRGPRGRLAGNRQADLTAAAAAIGIPVEQLRTELTPGTALATVARNHKVDPQKVIDALVAADKARLATEVKDGRLTQAQADSITAALPQRVADRVNGTRPADGPRGPHHPGGPGGRYGRPGSPASPGTSGGAIPSAGNSNAPAGVTTA